MSDPVGDDDALKAQFSFKQISDQIFVDMAGNAIDRTGIDHDRRRSILNGGYKGRQVILPQQVLRQVNRGAVFAIERRTVAQEVFRADGYLIEYAQPRPCAPRI